MFPVAVVLLVLDETGDAALAGGVVAAVTFPSLVTGPLAGAWLDRSERPFLLLAADQCVSAVAFAGLIVAVEWGAAPLLAISLAAGLLYPLSGGGFTSLLGTFVPSERMEHAVANEAANFHIAIVVGPALAGGLTALAGPHAAVAAQAALKVFALLALLAVGTSRRPVSPVADSVLATVAAGIRLIWRKAELRAVTVAGALSLGGRGLLTVAFPVFAAERLLTDESFGAYLWTAFAVGSIAGITLGKGRVGRWRAEHVVLLGIGAQGAAMFLWPLATTRGSALALVSIAGLLYGPALAATIAARQAWTPEGLKGQVFATSIALKPGTFAVGASVAGTLVTALGAEAVFLCAGGIQLVAVALGALVLISRP